MGNATAALIGKYFASIISHKTRHFKMAPRWLPHDTRNGEDTKGTL